MSKRPKVKLSVDVRDHITDHDEEDIPSDFFDDFGKEDFMAGLDVIDTWNDENPKSHGSLHAKLNKVNDLRELLATDGHEKSSYSEKRKFNENRDSRNNHELEYFPDDDFKRRRPNRNGSPRRLKGSAGQALDDEDLDKYIKPGSRRDPAKTFKAIRKDKEVKVKKILAKQLDPTEEDIKPPGTELDDFLNDTKRRRENHRKSPYNSRSRERERPRIYIPRSRSPQPRRIVEHRYRRSPSEPRQGRFRRIQMSRQRRSRSPVHFQRSRSRERRDRSPHTERRFSPPRQRFDLNYSSPQLPVHSFQPAEAYTAPAPGPSVYPSTHPQINPESYYPPNIPQGQASIPYNMAPMASYAHFGGVPHAMSGPEMVPPAFGYNAQDGSMISGPMGPMQAPMQVLPSQPVAPMMVPAPTSAPILPGAIAVRPDLGKMFPSTLDTPDALEKLLAEGKISRDDYLKLTPNKGKPRTMLELSERENLLSRCQDAVRKLTKLHLPNRLVMLNQLKPTEVKSIPPKFGSPLKRQPQVKFHFTSATNATMQNINKQLVDSILSTIELQQVIVKPIKKSNFKDVAVQTTKPFCECCEIRQATIYNTVGTTVDQEHFSSSTHTQVVEKDLISSKAVFTPGGGFSEGAAVSMSHLTSAQLVSQLAARAKNLQQVDPDMESNSYMRRQRFYPNADQPGPYGQYGDRGNESSQNQYSNQNFDYPY